MTLTVGQSAEITRSYTAEDVAAFAALGGGAPGDMVPEPLIGALFSYLLGVRLPGFGTNYLKQEMAFPAPAPLGAALTARVEITRLRPEKHLVDLATTCRTGDGTLVCTGRALVLARDVAGGFGEGVLTAPGGGIP
ncbi:MAG: phosphate acetyltransferase [Gemmobacter sp.]